VITPSVLAAQFRANPAWRGWSGAATAFSPVMFLGVLVFVGLHGRDGAGYAERALATAAAAGVVLLAVATRRVLTGASRPPVEGAEKAGDPPAGGRGKAESRVCA
jgi:hypothetical protein